MTRLADAPRDTEVAPASEPRSPSATVWILVAVLAATGFVMALAVRQGVFPYYSLDHDEPVYRFQAQMLEHGELTLPRSQEQFYRPWLSGPHGNRLVMAFPPGWPAVLAGVDAATGSMAPALGLAAALVAVATFLLAWELLRSPPRALVAAALVTLSPFVLMLSGTYLDYVWALGLEMLFSFLLLRGARTRALPLLAAGGAVWGVAFLTRPFDALLVLVPVAVVIVWGSWHERHELVRSTGAALLGAVPFVALTGVVNTLTGGSPLRFSTTVQSQNASRFGWGTRSIARDTGVVHFTPARAVTSLGHNLWGLPTWLLGAYIALGLAVLGAVRLRHDRRAIWVLGGIIVLIPFGYLFWWASALTAPGAISGIGPHYYLPMVAALAVLTAEGIFAFWSRRTAWAKGAVVAGVALSVAFIPSKLNEKLDLAKESRAFRRKIDRGIAGARGRDVLVVQERDPAPYVMQPFPYLANTPRLDGHVVYALDRGAATIDLLAQQPNRVPYRIVREITSPHSGFAPVLKPITTVSQPTVRVRAHLVNTSGSPIVVAYLGVGATLDRRVLDRSSTAGRSYDVEWTIDGSGTVRFTGAGVPASSATSRLPRSGVLTVGVATGHEVDIAKDNGNERRYYYRLRDGTVQIVDADEEWVHFGPPTNGSLPALVGRVLTVSFS